MSSIVPESKHSILDSLYIYRHSSTHYGYILLDKRTKNLISFDCGDYPTQRFNVESLMKEHSGGFSHLFLTTSRPPRCLQTEEWGKVHPGLNIIKPNTRPEGHIEFIGDLCVYFINTPGVSQNETSYVVTEVTESSDKVSIVFTGNTLLTGGCGDFTDTQAGWESLKKLRNLPSETLIFPGFEAAGRMMLFSKLVDGSNEFVKKKLEEVKVSERNIGQTIGVEKLYNPFLRADQMYFKDIFDCKEDIDCFKKMIKMMDKVIKS